MRPRLTDASSHMSTTYGHTHQSHLHTCMRDSEMQRQCWQLEAPKDAEGCQQSLGWLVTSPRSCPSQSSTCEEHSNTKRPDTRGGDSGSSSLLLMRWTQSVKVVWKQPWGSLGNHLRLKESRFSLVQSNCSITNSPRSYLQASGSRTHRLVLAGHPWGRVSSPL